MIEIYPDLGSLSQRAVELFVRLAKEAVAARGRFSVALSGGSTPRETYALLAQPPHRDGVDWSKVHVFWGDERCVPPDDPRSNARMALDAWLTQAPVPLSQIHTVRCAESPETAALEYEKELASFFCAGPPRFDLCFLGLGEDGHTASLFPHAPALAEREGLVAAVFPGEGALNRVTFTAQVFNSAAAVVFLVSGSAKAKVLNEVLEGPPDPMRLPAQLIRPRDGILRWLVDEEAARELDRDK